VRAADQLGEPDGPEWSRPTEELLTGP
jgi:hypothetical protein